MSDITLTAGIRQNLLSLQQTSAELTSTQEALATGKAVNSAADNPSAYFTAQNLTNDANSLSSLLDQIGQGLQTIDAANNGLTGITSLLQQALSTVQQAQSDSWTTAASATGSTNLGGSAIATASVNLAGFVGGSETGSVSGTAAAANALTINVGGSAYSVAVTSGETISAVAAAITGTAGLSGAVTATVNGSGFLVLTALSGTSAFTVAADAGLGVTAATNTSSLNTSAATTLSAGTLSINVGSTTYNVAITADSSLAQIESAINGTSGLSSVVTASDDGSGHLVLTSTKGNFTVDASSAANALGLTTAATATNAVTLNGAANSSVSAGTLQINVGSTTYSVSVASGATLAQVESDINNTTGLGSGGAVTASDDGDGHLILTSNSAPTGFTVAANALSTALGVTTNATTSNTPIGSSTTRATLQQNYNGLLSQITQMAADSGYNGVNLLGSDNLVIDFNQSGTSSLTIQGVDYSATGLNLQNLGGTSGGSFNDNGELSTLVS
ncbi:MAG: hypothetical protein WBF58_23005, partial [Xanthobacteraceae bacterium]